jgi:hypothetical protein
MARYKTLNMLEPGELVGVMSFIGLLKDADKYKAQVEELEGRKQEINDLIRVLGDVKEIESLRSSAYARNEEAARLREEAVRIKEDAKRFARKKHKDSTEEAGELVSKARADLGEREATWNKVEKVMAQRETALTNREGELTLRESAAEKLHLLATKTEKKYTKAIGSLNESLVEISKAL